MTTRPAALRARIRAALLEREMDREGLAAQLSASPDSILSAIREMRQFRHICRVGSRPTRSRSGPRTMGVYALTDKGRAFARPRLTSEQLDELRLELSVELPPPRPLWAVALELRDQFAVSDDGDLDSARPPESGFSPLGAALEVAL